MYLVTSEQMRCFDHYTIETHQVPGIVLMDHAGKAVAEVVLERQTKSVVIVCGKGNNGGDGWIAARWLQHAGCEVSVVSAADPKTVLTGDARCAYEMANAVGVPWQVYDPGCLLHSGADVYVDALLGTGCTRPLAGVYAEIVDELNQRQQAGAAVIAVDVPTGVDASTGETHGTAVQATETVAMSYEKLGTAVTPGAICAASVRVVDIGITAPLPEGVAEYVRTNTLRKQWGRRDALSHKGTYGRCGIYAGQMQGAAMLAAVGAARAGAGLIVLAARHPLLAHVPADYVVRVTPDPLSSLSDCDAIVLGPGLGNAAPEIFQQCFATDGFARMRGVIDADGLVQLVQAGNPLRHVGDGFVLTPHPKECARLLGWSTNEVQARRLTAAKQLAAQTGAIVLLKGYRTVIAHPDGMVRVNPTGNASLAVAGSGDVLAGVIGSLLAQGVNGFDAASLGAWLHGRAGELAGAALTPVSTMATDIANYISRAIMTFFDMTDAKT